MKTAAERKRKAALKKRDDAEALITKIEGDEAEDTPENRTAVKTLLDEADALDAAADEDDQVEQRLRAAKARKPLNRVNPAAQAGTSDGDGDDDEGEDKPAGKAWLEPHYGYEPKYFKGQHAAKRAHAFGMFCLAGLLRDERATKFCSEHGLAVRFHREGANSAGAVFVPEQFGTDIVRLTEEYGDARKIAKVVPMSSNERSDPRVTGYLKASPVGEGAAVPKSEMTTDRIGLNARKWGLLVEVTSELNEDSVINFADEILEQCARAFALAEDDALINADGTSAYHKITGLIAAFKALSATRANIAGAVVGSGNAWSELTLPDFNAAKGRLPAYALRNLTCLCSAQFYSTVIEKLLLAAGAVTPAMIAAGVAGERFLGGRLIQMQTMPVVEANDQIPFFIGDFMLGIRFGDRKQFSFAMSEHYNFNTDMPTFRAIERFDINVHDIGNADATAANRVAGPIAALFTAAA
jgi:HK97 family phage major capsid protein